MREIKFRGIYVDTDEFVYGYLLTHGYLYIIYDPTGIGTYHVIKQETIGQYIGLHDEKGKCLYEGDIITAEKYPFYGDKEFKELNYVGEVGIDIEGCYYDLRIVSDRVVGGACGGNITELKSFKIIGSIHKNPELIK